jgi:hypothetical protein
MMQIEPTPTPATGGNRTNQVVAALVAVIVLAAGVAGWWVGTQRSDSAQVSTEAPATMTADEQAGGTTDADDAEATKTAADDVGAAEQELETATAVPGAPLVFTDFTDANAPGGYNVWQNGRSNGLYYVLSTAPGVTWESVQDDCGGECWDPIRNDTLYTFDGSDWNRTDLADRFVTELSSTDNGLLYTLSTGSPAGPRLELGTSADTGDTWTWTDLDVAGQPGADSASARAITAERNGEFLIAVQTLAEIDWEEAAALARSAGIDITADQIWGVTTEGIEYNPPAATTDGPDCAAIDVAFHEENSPTTEYPFQDVDELTPEQEAELDAWYLAEQEAWAALELASAEHMAGVKGCEDYAVCLSRSIELRNQAAAGDDEMWAELGFGPDIDWDTITDEQSAALDAAYAERWAPYDSWFETSGCADVLGWYEGENVEWRTWEELGVTPPAAWDGSIHAHRVVDGVATDLGPITDEAIGWLVSLEPTADGWEVWIEGGTTETNLRHLTSTDGGEWTVQSENNSWEDVGFYEPQTDADGNEWQIQWGEGPDGRSRLVRTGTDGQSQSLSLDNLAGTADLNLDDHHFDNVRTGNYGTIVWASRWADNGDYDVDTVVFFTSDGVEWGATVLEGTYLVDAIVGDDEILAFGEQPALVNTGTPQPVFVATAG